MDAANSSISEIKVCVSMLHKGTFIPSMSRDIPPLFQPNVLEYDHRMSQTFRTALNKALQDRDIPLARVASETGVSYEQLKKLSQGKSRSTNVEDAILVANFFGMTLEEFLGDHTAILRAEIVDLYNQLTQEERHFLLSSAKGLLGDRNPGIEKSREENRADR